MTILDIGSTTSFQGSPHMKFIPATQALLAAGTLAFLLACSGGGGGSSSTIPTPTGPHLTTIPMAQAGYLGDQVTFRVVADGTGNGYQWLRNGTAISGATATTYPLSVQVADDQAHYSVRVTASSGGTTTSPDALLDVLYADPAVVAGHDHTLAITTKGKVYAWGVGGNGQLGLGDYQARMVPTAVPLPGPAVQVAAGWGHSLALLADGRLFAWGNNASGQLGDGTTTMRNTPALVPGFTNTIYIACGYNHNLAVKSDQSVWLWGYNSHGQLGQGDKVDRSTPVSIPAAANQIAGVALGELHTLILLTTHDLYGCGDNGYGQLGLPVLADHGIPDPNPTHKRCAGRPHLLPLQRHARHGWGALRLRRECLRPAGRWEPDDPLWLGGHEHGRATGGDHPEGRDAGPGPAPCSWAPRAAWPPSVTTGTDSWGWAPPRPPRTPPPRESPVSTPWQ